MSSGVIGTTAEHPLVCLVEGLETVVGETCDGPAWTLTAAQLTDLLPRLAKVSSQLDAVELAMLREADRHQVGDPNGFANTAGWWATVTRTTKPAAHKAVAMAGLLDQDAHAATAEAMGAGAVSVDQAAIILDAV